MPTENHSFHLKLQRSLTEAFKVLLSEKHLYQSIRVEKGFIADVAKAKCEMESGSGFAFGKVVNLESFISEGKRIFEFPWIPNEDPSETHDGSISGWVAFTLPTIEIYCSCCKKNFPFKPVYGLCKSDIGLQKLPNAQWIFLAYSCQGCDGEAIRFMVRRSDDKLSICGRDPMEFADIPAVIPIRQRAWFKKAIVAAQSGQILAGIFMLRVLVEQYWREITEVADAINHSGRQSGDVMGNAYKTTLPPDFKDRFPTLCDTYDDLSCAMHSASQRTDVFEKARDQIIEHFDARRLFKLDGVKQ